MESHVWFPMPLSTGDDDAFFLQSSWRMEGKRGVLDAMFTVSLGLHGPPDQSDVVSLFLPMIGVVA